MLQGDAWDRVAGRVMEADFYRKDHRLIYQAIDDLANTDRPRDVVTVSEWLQGRGQLEDAGGLAYLGTLANDVGSAANIGAYADIVRERSVYRKLIKVGTDITDMGFTPEGRPATELLDEAERKVLIGFRLGDLWTDIFTYTKGKNEGKPGVSLKARLLFVSWIKVDGQLVYKAEPKASEETPRDEAPAVSSETATQDAPASEEAIPETDTADTPALAESF